MNLTHHVGAVLTLPAEKPGEICPDAPAAMADAVTDLGGYVLFAVLGLVAVTIAASIGLMFAGKAANSPAMTRTGAGGLLVVLLGGILWVTVPGIFDGIIGTGCIG
jgi:hypothetical protein